MAETQDNRSREQCIALRQQGYSLRKIAELLGVSQGTVRHHTRHLSALSTPSVSRRNAGISAADYAPLPPSEDFAYFLGVFAGDGSLARLPRTVQLTISCDVRYPELIDCYVALLTRVTGKTPGVYYRGEGTGAKT